MQKKKSIRKECLNQRKQFEKAFVLQCSESVCERIMDSNEYQESSKLFVYAACRNEIDLSILIEHALENTKDVYFPRVFGEDMLFYKVNSMDDLEEGFYGILEPKMSCEPWEDSILNDSVNLMLLPGCAFSKKGQRIGYGKGYYDRFLNIYRRFIKMGVCYDNFLLPVWEADNFDVSVDLIVTDKRKVDVR